MKPARVTVRGMSYACVQDIAASWHDYLRLTTPTLEPAPRGLILHLAGPTDEGVRIIGVWEAEDAWTAFQTERLAQAVTALGGRGRPEPTFRGLHVAHQVVGAGMLASLVRLGPSRVRADRTRREEA